MTIKQLRIKQNQMVIAIIQTLAENTEYIGNA